MRYLIIALLFVACAPKITQTSSTVEKDSLSVKIVHHHDTVRIKGETITVIQKQTVHDTIIVEKQGRTELDITRKNGVTTTKCNTDSLQKALDFALRDTTRYRFIRSTITKPVLISKPKSDITKFCEWFTGLVLLGSLGFTAYKLKGKIPFI